MKNIVFLAALTALVSIPVCADSKKESGKEKTESERALKTEKFAQNIYALTNSAGHAYLFVGKDSALLVDTLFESDNILQAVREITQLPVQVVLTHGHPDHIGGMAYFDSCYIHKADAHLLPENKRVSYLSEGDFVTCGEFRFKVIEIPGHTDGSIALLDSNKKILIAGDSVQPGPIFMFGDGVDFKLYAQSMKKLLQYENDVEYVFAGHGGFPLEKTYIRYAFEDATDFLNGKLKGETVKLMGSDKKVYKGKHVSFFAD